MFAITATQCVTSFVASLICKCTAHDLWGMASSPTTTFSLIFLKSIQTVEGMLIIESFLLLCESSNWPFKELQFGCGVLEVDMECLKGSFFFNNVS